MSQFMFDTYTSDQISALQALLASKGVEDPDITRFLESAASESDLQQTSAEDAINQAANAGGIAVSGSATPATGVHTAATFSAQDWIASGVVKFDSATDNTKLIVQQAGIYLVTMNVSFNANATGFRECVVTINGSSEVCGDTSPAPAGDTPHLSAAGVELCAVGDYFKLDLFQSSGGGLACTYRVRAVQLGPTAVSVTTL